ncbi:MAG: HD domain-containing protein [Parcubacteria group bacterium]
MQYNDRIYSSVEIKEPVILELIACPAIQRLKEIDCSGYMKPHFPDIERSRFEHSLGVFLLLRKYNTSLEEQIAGLIHDVSHSAFSHCVDYALAAGSQKEQSHQDNIFDAFVRQTEIPKILAKYNIDINYILDESNFPLEENNIPDICADRIDYFLREGTIFKELSQSQLQKFLTNLTVKNNNWIFKNYAVASEYAQLFSQLNKVYWSGLPSAIMFITVGNFLKRSLAQKYITERDLYATDQAVLAQTKKHLAQDEILNTWWQRMNAPTKYFTSDPQDYDQLVHVKSRIVDPLCQHQGKTKRVSDVNKKWKKVVTEELKPKEYFIKFKG